MNRCYKNYIFLQLFLCDEVGDIKCLVIKSYKKEKKENLSWKKKRIELQNK